MYVWDKKIEKKRKKDVQEESRELSLKKKTKKLLTLRKNSEEKDKS